MSATSQGHILYCEDHDDTRALMTFILERAGFQVTPARNGTECMELAKSQRFALYLLDHTFPDSSGVTVCEMLREHDPDTPILFYSARAMQQEKEMAIRCGAQDYLIKPNDLFHIAEHVAKWINEAKKGNEK